VKIWQRTVGLAPTAFRAMRMVCGLALVMMACGGAALARGLQAPSPVPEIDPGSIKAALTLLGGGVLLMADRFRRRSR